MRARSASLTPGDWTKLIVGMTLLLGLLARLFPGLLAQFPLNDGGMFLVMIRDLRANSFLLPQYTSYNLSHIPFAYPPFGFYAGGLLTLLGIPGIDVLRWLPVAVNLASVPAFFLLAKKLLGDSPRAAVATMIYALVPGNFAWQIMGGGLTRAFGILFILLANASLLEMFRSGRWNYVGLSALFCALAVLSHPEVSLATLTSCALFWLFFGRTRQGTLQAAAVALGTLVLTAPWWGSVIAMHGLVPFQAVMYSGAYNSNALKMLFAELFAFDGWTGLFHLLYLAGIAWCLYRRQFFLPAWLVLPFLVEPRSSPAFAYFPASMMAALVLTDLLPGLVDRLRHKAGPPDFTQRAWLSAAILGLMMLWFVQGTLYGFRLANTSLRPPIPQEAMRWVAQNTQPDSQFLILTGSSGIMTDPVQEWFPALAERKSNSTLQGYEWTLGRDFFPRLQELVDLQDCRDSTCVRAWSAHTGLIYTHLLLERSAATQALEQSLRMASEYEVSFENDQYVVFQKTDN